MYKLHVAANILSRGEFVQTRRSKMHRNAVGKTRINALVTFKPHYKRDTCTYTNIHNVLIHTHTEICIHLEFPC